MSIIISGGGINAIKLDKTAFVKEGHLQEYIHQNPDSIPVYELQEDKKLFVAAREFPTQSGPVDALGVDKDGDIYLIETKLYKNPDKRAVIAQALDYGASLWKHYRDFDEFTTRLNEKVQSKFNLTFEDKVKEVFDLEEESYQTLRDSMKTNLQSGKIKFVILMDSLDERLKDLILYVNQNSRFDIYAVQLEYYKFEKYEIVIPKMFGGEIKKAIETSDDRKTWTKSSFIEEAKQRINGYAYEALIDLYEFSEKKADQVELGTGKETGSVTFKFRDHRAKSGLVSVFTIYSDGLIQFRFANIKKRIGDEYSELYDAMLTKIVQFKNWTDDDVTNGKGFGPKTPLSEAFPKKEVLESFKSMILEFVSKAKKNGEAANKPGTNDGLKPPPMGS